MLNEGCPDYGADMRNKWVEGSCGWEEAGEHVESQRGVIHKYRIGAVKARDLSPNGMVSGMAFASLQLLATRLQATHR